ncbi:MAG: 2-amino-4-hydroxy-6-hydroxymethyldihydropteridine diphosphokinase [Candidatus Omnitrophica bacterium]|nr:2-amino-4-hydroxy-6-hydroxymethyldihydropteridine diphosphokinase [Candidatus Omnitrophota bacterium]
MKDYYLSIGSNIEPEKNIPACLVLLKIRYPAIRFSQVYETDPVGPAGTEKFWNLAAVIPAAQSVEDLRTELRKIEASLGRVRAPGNRFLPRVIDIDILPQADYETQAFIMIPLAEIAPLEQDEKSGKTFAELAEGLQSAASGFRKILSEDH